MVVNGITIKIHLKDWESEETFKKLLDKEVDRLNDILFQYKIERMRVSLIGRKTILISIPDDDRLGDKTKEAFDKLLTYLSTVSDRIELVKVESIEHELRDYVDKGILEIREAPLEHLVYPYKQENVLTAYYRLLKFK